MAETLKFVFQMLRKLMSPKAAAACVLAVLLVAGVVYLSRDSGNGASSTNNNTVNNNFTVINGTPQRPEATPIPTPIPPPTPTPQPKPSFTMQLKPGTTNPRGNMIFVGHSIQVEGTCESQKTFFILVEAIVYTRAGRTSQFWIQRLITCQVSGTWSATVWACEENADYSVVAVEPSSQASPFYHSWYENRSGESESVLRYREEKQITVLATSPDFRIDGIYGTAPQCPQRQNQK